MQETLRIVAGLAAGVCMAGGGISIAFAAHFPPLVILATLLFLAAGRVFYLLGATSPTE
jgi:hypothetical protein